MKICRWDAKIERMVTEEATCESCNDFVADDHNVPQDCIGRCCSHPPKAGNTSYGFGFPSIFKSQCCGEWAEKIV